MNREEAMALARAHLDDLENLNADATLQLVEDATIEKAFGWVFFYNSSKYLESGSPSDALLGNAPIIVKRDGTLHATGTAHPIEHYIAELERESG